MARRDGTGPWGQGAMTGRGFGSCPGPSCVGRGGRKMGMGRRGLGYGYGYGGYGARVAVQVQPQDRSSSLQEYKEMLKNELKWVNEELDKD